MWSLMPRIALYIYMGFYFYHSVSTVVEDIKDEAPLWIIDFLQKSDSLKMLPAKSLAFALGQGDFCKRSNYYRCHHAVARLHRDVPL